MYRVIHNKEHMFFILRSCARCNFLLKVYLVIPFIVYETYEEHFDVVVHFVFHLLF